LSECFVVGGRAAVAALELPAPDSKDQAVDEPPAFEPPTTETREAVWQLAGPIRDRQGLEALEGDDYPLARAIGATALAREESRGGHRRSDYPDTDPDLDRTHLVYAPDGTITRKVWD
ncbi:MAG: aspartate oxidase, partial [Solirubrobacterales bacterium]